MTDLYHEHENEAGEEFSTHVKETTVRLTTSNCSGHQGDGSFDANLADITRIQRMLRNAKRCLTGRIADKLREECQ